MRRFFRVSLAMVLTLSMSGCLGTMVQSPTAAGEPFTTTKIHFVAFPTQIEARVCEHGIAETFTFVPLWGVVVGVLTIGIIVPMTTSYSCVPSPG